MSVSEISAMGTDEPEQASSSNVWKPEVEDDVDSVDENPDDYGTGAGGVPGSSQSSMAACPSVDCSKHRIALERRTEELHSKIRSLQTELRKLREAQHRKNETSKRAPEKRTKRTWPERLRRASTNASGDSGYAEIYKLSCYEENTNTRTIHPALAFKAPSARIASREARALVDQEIRAAKTAKALRVLVLLPRKRRLFLEYRTRYSFGDLPIHVKQRIFKLLFSYPDKLIHAISRLDQFVEPAEIPPVGGRRSGLLNRFHVTGKYSGHSCSLTYAIKGNDLLAPLLVSRQFLFLGAHAFYGCNTFAFSSLGEFGRFSTGIGTARRQRLQHVEILWIGSQAVKMEGHSRRTWALAHLCDMARLRSLTMYIDESHVRRKQEGIVQMAYLAGKTSGQPDFRMSRNLRTLQGLDYVRQLRGLRVLRILENKTCKPVRDWSFLLDLETTCKRDKPYAQHKKSTLKNLKPLLRRFSPSKWEWEAVEPYYDLEWNPERAPENDDISMANPSAPAISETHTLPTDAGEQIGPQNQVEDAADVDNNSIGVLVGSVSRTGNTRSLPEAGDGDHVSTVAGIGGNDSDRNGNVPEMRGSSHAAASQAGDRDMGTAGFDMMDIDEVNSTSNSAQAGQDLLTHPPPEPSLDTNPEEDHGAMSGRPGQALETEAEKSLFVEDPSGRPPLEPSVDSNHEDGPGADDQSQAFETKLEEGLLFEDLPVRPTTESNLNASTEGHLDEPPGYPGQNLELESRGKTPKSELRIGPEPVSPDRKLHEQDNVDERAGSENREVSPGIFEMCPSQGAKRPPSRALKRPPSQGTKRPPSQGSKHPASHGGKRLPSYRSKHPHMPLREYEDTSDRSSAEDEGSSSSGPDEDSDDDGSTSGSSPEGGDSVTSLGVTGTYTQGAHGSENEDGGMDRTDKDAGEISEELQADANSSSEKRDSGSEEDGMDVAAENGGENIGKQRADTSSENGSGSKTNDRDSKDKDRAVDEGASEENRPDPLASENGSESSDGDAPGGDGAGALETGDDVDEMGGDEGGNKVDGDGDDGSDREDVESGNEAMEGIEKDDLGSGNEGHMNDDGEADLDNVADRNIANNERDRATRMGKAHGSSSADDQERNGSSSASGGGGPASIAATAPPAEQDVMPVPDDPHEATPASKTKKRKGQNMSSGRTDKIPRMEEWRGS